MGRDHLQPARGSSDTANKPIREQAKWLPTISLVCCGAELRDVQLPLTDHNFLFFENQNNDVSDLFLFWLRQKKCGSDIVTADSRVPPSNILV